MFHCAALPADCWLPRPLGRGGLLGGWQSQGELLAGAAAHAASTEAAVHPSAVPGRAAPLLVRPAPASLWMRSGCHQLDWHQLDWHQTTHTQRRLCSRLLPACRTPTSCSTCRLSTARWLWKWGSTPPLERSHVRPGCCRAGCAMAPTTTAALARRVPLAGVPADVQPQQPMCKARPSADGPC